MAKLLSTSLPFLLVLFASNYAMPQQGVWNFDISKETPLFFATKSIYKDGQVSVTIFCEFGSNTTFKLTWMFRRSSCANEYIEMNLSVAKFYLQMPWLKFLATQRTEYVTGSGTYYCDKHKRITLHAANSTHPIKGTDAPPPVKANTVKDGSDDTVKPAARKRRATYEGVDQKKVEEEKKPAPKVAYSEEQIDHEAQYLLKTWADGYYLFVLNLDLAADIPEDFLLKANVKIGNGNSYVAAVDFPLLVFYGVMALVYLGFGIVWLFLLACNWPDLHRIHFWIGGIILIGMIENAVFFGEYENINNTGQSVRGAIIFAELVSCLKRSLARMLVIIVSLGYGIVMKSLGNTFYKVMIVGAVFFILASIEGRIWKLNEGAEKYAFGVLLLVTDIFIFCWIIKALGQTLRILRLGKDIVKLSVYKHFRNILIIDIIDALAYMIWFLVEHRFKECLSDWKTWWVNDAIWHLFFILILIAIMVLWRPTSYNLRYVFSPLLEAADDSYITQAAPKSSGQVPPLLMDQEPSIIYGGYRGKKILEAFSWKNLASPQIWINPHNFGGFQSTYKQLRNFNGPQ